MKAFVYQRVYTPRVVGHLRVYSRKRSAAVSKLPIVKMLIQSALTLANKTKGPVLPAASHLGVTCRSHPDAVGSALFASVGTEAREQRYWKRVPTIQSERRREAEASDYRS
jgi:hypothetical protein